MISQPRLSIFKKYIQSNQQTDEFELRFGINYSNKITRIDFDNVIKKLKLNNFTCESPMANII